MENILGKLIIICSTNKKGKAFNNLKEAYRSFW